MNLDLLNSLIIEGEYLTQNINYVPPGDGVWRSRSIYNTSEKERYQNWQSSAQRFVNTFHKSELEEVKEASKELNPDNHLKILGILRAIKLLPNEPEKLTESNSHTNHIQITNNQSVSQQMTVHLFLDAVKDELTGKDFKAIQEIVKDYEKEPEKTKSKLTEKLKGFGEDVLSNIVSNILTNPAIYNGIL